MLKYSRILDAKVGTKLGEHVFLVLERTFTNSLGTILEQEMSKNIAQIPLGPKIEKNKKNAKDNFFQFFF